MFDIISLNVFPSVSPATVAVFPLTNVFCNDILYITIKLYKPVSNNVIA